MQHLKEIVLPNYPLVLSLLKYRNVWVFWNKKKSGSNRCNLLNSSIDDNFDDIVLRKTTFYRSLPSVLSYS